MENAPIKNRKNLVFAGLGLQIFALVFAYLCLAYIPFIGWLPAFYIAPPIFIVGIIFIFFSKIRLIYRFILGFWIIAIPVGITGEHYFQRQFIQNKIYLIPQNYRGPVTVNFGEPGGTAPGFENKVVVLKVDSNGTLKTTYIKKRLRQDFEAERESFREYYYVDDSGGRTKLHLNRYPQENELIVIPRGEYYSDDVKTITKLEFYVGTQAEFYQYLKTK